MTTLRELIRGMDLTVAEVLDAEIEVPAQGQRVFVTGHWGEEPGVRKLDLEIAVIEGPGEPVVASADVARSAEAKLRAHGGTCGRCGGITVQTGTCQTCTSCGDTSGCG